MTGAGRFIKRHRDIFLNLTGVVVGLALGFLLRAINSSALVLFWIGFPGTLYIRFLTMMIVPLAIASLISGAGTFDHRRGGKFGCILLALVLFCNVICVVTSLGFISLALKPEKDVNDRKVGDGADYSAIIATLLRNFVPDNLVTASFQRVAFQQDSDTTITNSSGDGESERYAIPQVMHQTPNMLGIVLMSIIFGIAAGCDKEKNAVFINFCKALFNLSLKIVSTLRWIIPLGTISLTAAAIGGIDDLRQSFLDLVVFLGVLLAGVGLHQLVTLPLMVFLANKKNPLIVMRHGWRAWLMVFSTASSIQALPEAFDACDQMAVSREEAEVGVPLAMMTNASGIGVYIGTAAYLLAYLQGVTFSASHYLILSILSMTSAISLNVVPNGALAALIIVLSSMDLATTEIGLLIAVEWIADRLRSPCNIMTVMSCVYAAHQFTPTTPDEPQQAADTTQKEPENPNKNATPL